MITNEIALLTPPLGVNLFIAMNLSNLPLERVAKGACPYIFLLPGDILRCGIKWEYFVQILMVEFLRDYFFDAGEIYHHSFGVEPCGTAIDGDNPVVTV